MSIANYKENNSELPEMKQVKRRESTIVFSDDLKEVYDWLVSFYRIDGSTVTGKIRSLIIKAYNEDKNK